MKGPILAEAAHVINILPPVDISGGAASDVFFMKWHEHVTIIVQVGASAAAFTKLLVEACDDFVPSNTVAIPFGLYKEETAGGDTLAAREQVAATGYTPSANDNIFYVIEVDVAELPDGFKHLRINLTNGVNSVIASAVAILSGARDSSRNAVTAIA